MREVLCEIFMDVLEVNIVVSAVFLIVFLLAGKLRKRYGAGWLKVTWILLAVRLLIPYNFALPGIGLADLFRTSTVEIEEENSFQTEMQAEAGRAKENNIEKEQAGDSQKTYQEEGEGMKGVSDEIETNLYFEAASDEEGENFWNGQPEQTEKRVIISNTGESFWKLLLVIGMRCWLTGMCICLFYQTACYVYFSFKITKSLQQIIDTNIRRQIARLQKERMGKVRMIAYQSTVVNSPMIMGIFGPRLILPARKELWSEKELEFIVSHELCHYQKKDLWLKLLMTAAWCVNWFNPLIYILKKQFYFEVELACDGDVLSECSAMERESYARIMLSFAGGHGREAFYSTGFSGSKKKMKQRIDYMMEDARKRKGIVGMTVTGLMILAMGLLISCGYQQPEEENRNMAQGEADADDAQEVESQAQEEREDFQANGTDGEEAQSVPFNVNNEYNEMIRSYGDNIYISRTDGIYCLSDDGESEVLLYANDYEMRRGMELYRDYLYFCGSARRGEQEAAATIYRMDLNTFEVEDALASFSNVFDSLYQIAVYEDKLYVAGGYSQRIGFELDGDGRVIGALDEQAEDFLFKEDNEYWGLQLKIWNNEVTYDTEEYWDVVEQMSGMYRSLIDAAACRKMLNGDQVVMKYKDELLSSVYLKKKDGDYELLCDVNSYPPLVTETGVYYFGDESNSAIWYVDYETKTQRKIWEREDRKHREIQLVNYDQEYIYFTASNEAGQDAENENVLRETYLMRVPRWREDAAEKIYQFDLEQRVGTLQRNCAVAGGKMFFCDDKTISLEPAQNGMEEANSGRISEDAEAMKQTMETFAAAYFQNDAQTLESCLTEDFEGDIELYPYPERAGVIEGTYISGLPDGNLPMGVSCFVSYKFRGHAETDEEDAFSYLSTEMVKTTQGWRISFYGLEI